jgi:hypothetical protein
MLAFTLADGATVAYDIKGYISGLDGRGQGEIWGTGFMHRYTG